MTTILDTLTGIDTSNGPVISTDMSNSVYHGERGHVSRSAAHRYRGVEGGRAQRFVEVYKKSLFTGNSATNFGSLIDGAVECEMRGVDWKSQIAVPPESVLATDGSRRGKPYTEWKQTIPAGGFECSAGLATSSRRFESTARPTNFSKRRLTRNTTSSGPTRTATDEKPARMAAPGLSGST